MRLLGVQTPEGGDDGPWAAWEALAVKVMCHSLLPGYQTSGEACA
ncbi:unnamed protein product [Ectocarpus fasciculatus]